MSDGQFRTNAALRREPPELSTAGAVAVAEANAAERAEWDEYVARAPSAELYHDYRWRTLVEELFGHQTVYLVARDAVTLLPTAIFPPG